MVLTKQGITEAIRLRMGVSRPRAVEITEALIKLLKDTLAAGEDVLVSRFGKFQVRKKSERRGRNPATGGRITLKPRRVVTFKPASNLKELLNPTVEIGDRQ
ncbi:MAG: integration host factor subunit alpha [Pseudomonadota bacterium]